MSLGREGLRPWLDKWNLIPGETWQPAIEKALADCATCAVIIGRDGFGPWHHEEMRAAVDRRVGDREHDFRVIPVLLPGVERPERSKLPSFLVATTWVEFHDTLDDPEALHRLVCGIRGIEPGPGPAGAVFEGQCPYRGLELFDVQHAPLFFGREALTEWLIDKLKRKPSGVDNRFLAIVGASGSGKSSLARAGMLAALKDGKIVGSASWPQAICRPGSEPFFNLARALTTIAPEPVSALVFDRLQSRKDGERSLHVAAGLVLGEPPRAERLVVLVDQFEEVFTLCTNDSERRDFLANLLHAATLAGGRTIVVLTMRADFYPRCAAHAELAAALSDQQVLVGPMTEEELRRAITRPAQLSGLEPEPGLVELLMEDLHGRPGALPLLQFALQELWRRREGHRLTIRAYRDIGAIEGALKNHAQGIYQALSPAEQELCRRIFLRLIQPGEGNEDTRRRVSFHEMLPADPTQADAVRTIIGRLADPEARLITTEGEPDAAGDGSLEVAHEALIRGWPQLRQWVDADRAGLRTHRRLTDAARDWESAPVEAKGDFLYSGARLAVAAEWAATNRDRLSPSEQAFLQASEQTEHEQQRQDAKRRLLIGTLLAALVPALLFGAVAWYQRAIAKEQERRARTAGLMAKRSEYQAIQSERQARDRAKVAELATTDLLDLYRKPCDLVGRIATADSTQDALAALDQLLRSTSVTDETIRSRLRALQEDLLAANAPTVAAGAERPTYRFENEAVLRGLLHLTRAYSEAWIRRRESLKKRDPALADEVLRLQYLIMLQPVIDRASNVIRDFDEKRGYEASRDAIKTFWNLYYGDSYLIESLGTTDRTRELGKSLESGMVQLSRSLESWRVQGQPPQEFSGQLQKVREILGELRRELEPKPRKSRDPL